MDEGIKQLMELVSKEADADAFRAGGMTIGKLVEELKSLPYSAHVVSTMGTSIGGLRSYRGYYERLAIDPTWDEDEDERAEDVIYTINVPDPCTVGDLIDALGRATEDDPFYGYKGGEFFMNDGTLVHMAEYSCLGPLLVGVVINPDSNRVTLLEGVEI